MTQPDGERAAEIGCHDVDSIQRSGNEAVDETSAYPDEGKVCARKAGEIQKRESGQEISHQQATSMTNSAEARIVGRLKEVKHARASESGRLTPSSGLDTHSSIVHEAGHEAWRRHVHTSARVSVLPLYWQSQA